MNASLILIAVLSLGGIGAIGAIVLYLIARKFQVYEDPRIAEVEEVLPQANCGGCGYPGCKGFAEACVKAGSLEGLRCPVGGNPVMKQVAERLGLEVTESAPKIAVVRCNGTCYNRPQVNTYDGAKSCAIENTHFVGEGTCAYGCLGCGDCVAACPFGAITMNPDTNLPEVDEEKCVACGACVAACPRHIIELRKKGPKGRRVYVRCMNEEKGAVAMKSCITACLGCGKCAKTCPFEAITVTNNLAYIDDDKCRMCRKCVDVCPTQVINAVNFPPKKAAPAAAGAKPAAKPAEAKAPVADKAAEVKAAPAEKPAEAKAPVEEKKVEAEVAPKEDTKPAPAATQAEPTASSEKSEAQA